MRLRLFFIAILAILSSEFYGQAKVNSGFVFINGKYIDAPYHVHTKDMAVYINGYQITKALEWPVVNKHSFDQDPGISPDFEKYTSIEEASNMREPTSGVLYHAAKQWYLFSHYDYDEALQKSIEYFENLPYVKSLTLTPEGYWLLESYNGQKRQILIGGPDMEYMNHIWGPNGIGPPSKAEMDEQVRNRAKRYLKRLEKGDLFVIESPGNEVSYAERKAAIILPEFIKIMDGKISDRKKTDELVSIGLIPETNKKHAESIVQNFRKSSKMKKRVENLVQRVEKEHGVQPQIKRNSDSKMRQLKDQKLLEGSTPGLKANVGAYSPDGKAIYAGCAYTFEGGFGMFNNEIQQVIDDVKEQDFNSTANIYKDDTNQDSLTGNLSYATFKSLKYGDICYWASHGGRGTGLYIIKVRSKDDVNLWSGNDSLNVIPVEVTTENWPTGHPWFGYVQPAWATNNWNAVLTLSKAITFLSCCYSHQNGWAAACGGGVTIGYDTISFGNTIMINNREFLQRMSGKKGNGNKRKAFEAYNDMPAHHDKMKIVPANAQITLAPGPYDFLPKDGDYVLNNGTGYFEVDTWCHDNVSADQALTFATTGNVTISNVQWDGSNKVKKVTFDWTGDACWEVTVTVHNDKWQSWGAATPSYHKLDVNRVAPNTENGVYTFYSADTLILTMTHTDVLCHGGSDGTATVTVTNGTSPYTYKWSPSGGNAATATGLSAGTYKVIVTDANNCNGQQTVIIAEPAELKLSISGGGFIPYCIQDGPPTITLSANASGGTPPYIYSWPGGSRSVSSSGFYSCAVIDDNGCIESATVFVWFIPIVCSRDPNDIAGPIGYEPGQWVSINDQLPYTIRFENDPDFATAPAQVVTVTCPFDDNLNPFSLRLGDFGFANYIFNVPANSIFYSQRLDVVDSLGVYVDVLAGIDVNNNEAFWIFESIDPTTGLPPTDAMTGFLPVNDSIFHRGEGFVSYTVAPKSTSVTGDSIFATAEIVFDINESILTNTWENIIDAVPPTSTMDTLPTYTSSQLIPLSWSAIDDPGGVGVGYYDLMYSKDGGAIQVQVTGLDTSYYEFPANNNSSYDFYVIAIDRVGNREPNKTVPDVSIVVGAPTLAITQPTQTDVYCVGDVMTILWEVTGIGLINIDISNDAGASYTPMLTQFDASVGEYTYPIPQSFVASDTCLLRLYSDGMTHVTNSDLFRIKALPVVDLGAASTYGLGDQVVLDAGAGYSAYTWNNSEITQQISFMGYEAGLGSHIFSVSVTDIYSCAGSGSVTILIEGSDTCTQSINLPVNWSMFSGYVYPFTPNMIDVTSAITSDIIMIKDKKGDVYWPYFLLNNIGDMLVGDGYQAKLFNAATLVLEGECVVPELTPLSLDVGWSLIGYLRQTPASVITMFSPISSSTIMVKNSQGHVYWVYFGIDQIGNMNPGEGYQVKMSASDVLTYPANSANISKKTVINLRSEYFGEILNTGNNMTLGIPLSAWENIPDKGDEIAVFTHSGLLVGSGVFEEGNLAICIWGNDKLSDYQDGIADNEKFTVKLWNKKEGSLSKIEVTQWIEGDNSYSPNRISIMGKLTLSEKNSQDEVVIHQNKPNPFKGKTEISFYLPEKMQVELSVYDAIGEKLIELIPESDMSGGLHKYEFDARNLATGTYFYKLTTPDKTYTKALNLIN